MSERNVNKICTWGLIVIFYILINVVPSSSDMLQMGSSKPWPEALEKITGSTIMTAQPLVDYFQPLITWLETENDKMNEVRGWSKDWVPKGEFT